MRHAIWVSCLLLTWSFTVPAMPDAFTGQRIKAIAVQSFNVDMQNQLVIRTRDTGAVQVPDNTYDNGSGVILVFRGGVIVSVEMRGTKVAVESVAKSGGKISLRGAELSKIHRQNEMELPSGTYMSQDPNDPPEPQPQPDPGPTPQGFEIKDGVVVTILVSSNNRG